MSKSAQNNLENFRNNFTDPLKIMPQNVRDVNGVMLGLGGAPSWLPQQHPSTHTPNAPIAMPSVQRFTPPMQNYQFSGPFNSLASSLVPSMNPALTQGGMIRPYPGQPMPGQPPAGGAMPQPNFYPSFFGRGGAQ